MNDDWRERARRIGQYWLDQLDDLEAAARPTANGPASPELLLMTITEMLEAAQAFCAALFDPATAPRAEGKADERPLPAVVPAPPETPGVTSAAARRLHSASATPDHPAGGRRLPSNEVFPKRGGNLASEARRKRASLRSRQRATDTRLASQVFVLPTRRTSDKG